jgi:hypothetical protein
LHKKQDDVEEMLSFSMNLKEWTPYNKYHLKSINNLKNEAYWRYKEGQITKKQLNAIFDRIEQERLK